MGVPVYADPLDAIVKAQAVIDFTSPEATLAHAQLTAQARCVHVIGTTGFSDDDIAALDAAARHATIVRAGNMSLGVNLLTRLVQQIAPRSTPISTSRSWRKHHRHKVDAPSGTALMLGRPPRGARCRPRRRGRTRPRRDHRAAGRGRHRLLGHSRRRHRGRT
jgi:4-hydroxy-tetrahydrodipicolinate reductase